MALCSNAAKCDNAQYSSNSIIENQDLFEIMKNEQNRFNSFDDKWPLNFISIQDLVKCGFFYLLSEDKVQCAFCKLILTKWEIGDKPLEQHQKFFPKCPFILNSVKTVKSQSVTMMSNFNSPYIPSLNAPCHRKPKVPRMSDVEKRLSTFKGWSFTMISIEDLALCGLYYTGVDDVVTCFSCGISLGDWEPYEEPMTKHTKYYSNCVFLHFIISSGFVKLHKNIQKPFNSYQNLISRQPLKPSLAEILKSELVLQAKEIFPTHLVEEVVSKHINETGEMFSSLQHLCEKVLEYEENKLRIRLDDYPKRSEQPIKLCDEKLPSKSQINKTTTTPELMCKICLSDEMRIVFQPCGHLMSCESCGQQVSKCPICRQPIQNRIKTYLS